MLKQARLIVFAVFEYINVARQAEMRRKLFLGVVIEDRVGNADVGVD